MPTTREHHVEAYLVMRVNAIGGICYKWVSPGHRGVPDRIVIFKGIVYFVEVKTIDGQLSDSQKRERARIEKAGGLTSVVFGKAAVDLFINGLLQLVDERNRIR